MARGAVDDVLDWVRSQKTMQVYNGVLEPKDKTEFEFGRLHGYVACLEQLETVIQAALDKEKRRV